MRGGTGIQCGSAVVICAANSSGDAIENHLKKQPGSSKVSRCSRKNNLADTVIENRCFMILVLVVIVMLRDRTLSYTYIAHVRGLFWRQHSCEVSPTRGQHTTC